MITDSMPSVDTWSQALPARKQQQDSMASTASSGPVDYITLVSTLGQTMSHGSWKEWTKQGAKAHFGNNSDSLGGQINTYFNMRNHVNKIRTTRASVACWHSKAPLSARARRLAPL